MCMKTALKANHNHITLQMKNVWDYYDTGSFSLDRYTTQGFHKYWGAIDSAIEFWHTNLAPKSYTAKAAIIPTGNNQGSRPRSTAKAYAKLE